MMSSRQFQDAVRRTGPSVAGIVLARCHGRGRFLDGNAFRTGFGSTTYWSAFVANLEMHGNGTFFDRRLNDAVQFPVAAKAGSGNTRSATDQITSQLAALHRARLQHARARRASPQRCKDVAI